MNEPTKEIKPRRHVVKIEVEIADELLRASPHLIAQAMDTVASMKIRKRIQEITGKQVGL